MKDHDAEAFRRGRTGDRAWTPPAHTPPSGWWKPLAGGVMLGCLMTLASAWLATMAWFGVRVYLWLDRVF